MRLQSIAGDPLGRSDFTVIEDGVRLRGESFFPHAESAALTRFIRPEPTVCDTLTALRQGLMHNRPVLLDRGTGFEPDQAPDEFCVGILTSGTTGKPKCIWHQSHRLFAGLRTGAPSKRWLLCYSPHSYAGLQVILHVCATGGELVASTQNDASGLIDWARKTHPQAISATPSLWRILLVALPRSADWAITDITLGGEAVDDGLLRQLADRWPGASLRHVYASTEVGSVFSIKDGRAGFPVQWLDSHRGEVSLRIEGGMLYIRSERAGLGFGGWHLTGDRVEVCGDRVHFVGREDALLNVGGEKVDLEQLERQFLELPEVLDVRLFGRRNPITGYLVEAEVVARDRVQAAHQIESTSGRLRPVERPRRVHFVDRIELGPTGKKPRRQ